MSGNIIRIYRGDEYRARVRQPQKDEIDYEIFKRLFEVFQEIKASEDEVRNSNSCLNKQQVDPCCSHRQGISQRSRIGSNTILLCGKRGQGKTSMLLSFYNCLTNKSCEDSAGLHDCIVSDILDPSMLAPNESLVRIFTSMIYRRTLEIKKCQKNNECTAIERRMATLFRDIYEMTGTVRNGKTNEAYDDLSSLTKLSNSAKIRDCVEELVSYFLDYNGYNPEKSTLVLIIDDLDLCTSNVFDLCEELRKYLLVPNIIVVMAADYNQLQHAIYQHYLSDYKELITHQKAYIVDSCSQMTGKYLEKMFPPKYRIEFSNLRLKLEDTQIEILDSAPEDICFKQNGPVNQKENQNYFAAFLLKSSGIFLFDEEKSGHLLYPSSMRELTHILKIIEYVPNDNQNILHELKKYFLGFWSKSHLTFMEQNILSSIDDNNGSVSVAYDMIKNMIKDQYGDKDSIDIYEFEEDDKYSIYALMYMVYHSPLTRNQYFCAGLKFYYTLYLLELYKDVGDKIVDNPLIKQYFISEYVTGKVSPFKFTFSKLNFGKITDVDMLDLLKNGNFIKQVGFDGNDWVFDMRRFCCISTDSHRKGVQEPTNSQKHVLGIDSDTYYSGDMLSQDQVSQYNQAVINDESRNSFFRSIYTNMDLLQILQNAPGHIEPIEKTEINIGKSYSDLITQVCEHLNEARKEFDKFKGNMNLRDYAIYSQGDFYIQICAAFLSNEYNAVYFCKNHFSVLKENLEKCQNDLAHTTFGFSIGNDILQETKEPEERDEIFGYIRLSNLGFLNSDIDTSDPIGVKLLKDMKNFEMKLFNQRRKIQSLVSHIEEAEFENQKQEIKTELDNLLSTLNKDEHIIKYLSDHPLSFFTRMSETNNQINDDQETVESLKTGESQIIDGLDIIEPGEESNMDKNDSDKMNDECTINIQFQSGCESVQNLFQTSKKVKINLYLNQKPN